MIQRICKLVNRKTRLPLIFLLTFFFSLSPISKINAASVLWDGGGNGSTWSDPLNWSDDEIPNSEDDVLINSTVTVNITSVPDSIKSLTLGNISGTTSPILNFAYDAISTTPLNIVDGDLIVYTNATITHSDALADSVVGRVGITVSGDITISGKIDTNKKGYQGGNVSHHDGYGPGAGISGCDAYSQKGGGGGYGGIGATSYSLAPGGQTYSNAFEPFDLGSGSGTGNPFGSCESAGDDGGGAIKVISLTGTITVNGSITSNGGTTSNWGAGGGSGGSIYLSAATLTGTGSITANGGGGNNGGGCGSGGRITIQYSSTNSLSGTITAISSSGYNSPLGQNGTVIFLDTTNDDLYIKNSQYWDANPNREGSLHTFRNIYVQNSSTWTLKGYYTNDTDGIGFVFNVDNFDIETGSTVSANATGYRGGSNSEGHLDGYGPGGGIDGCTVGNSGGGGGYGGNGGNSSSGNHGGFSYSNAFEPVALGSGGGTGEPNGICSSIGSKGGGAIKIVASETITIGGTISANGENVADPPNWGAGGGSGGSIYLISSIITGSGNITANGGGGNNGGGDGSGGRISIKYSTSNIFTGSLSAITGAGYNSPPGDSGTIVVLDTTNDDLYIKNSQYWDANPNREGSLHTFRNIYVQNSSTWTLKGYYTNDTDGIGFEFNVTNFNIETGSTVSANATGYLGGLLCHHDGYGPGAGTSGCDTYTNRGGGGAYGGTGGISTTGAPGGITYGSETSPIDLGSGGGTANPYGSCESIGGEGGGAIKIFAADTINVVGNITANGRTTYNPPSWGAGGGSGGSIYLIAQTLSGSGSITTNGGGSNNGGGNGGGGRISLFHGLVNSLSGTITSNKGVGGNGGSNGTVYTSTFNLPTASTPSDITQYTDASGYVTFQTTVSDLDSDDTKLRVEYSDDGGSTWNKATLVSVIPDTGDLDLDNEEEYQIGSTNKIDSSSEAVSLTVIWNSMIDIGSTRNTNIKLRVVPNDFFISGVQQESQTFEVDNLDPSGIGELNVVFSSLTSQTLSWTSIIEDNFDHYEIWYGRTLIDVQNRQGDASEWDNTDDLLLETRTTSSTTISSLLPGFTFYFKIWAIDTFGNEISSSPISVEIASNQEIQVEEEDNTYYIYPELPLEEENTEEEVNNPEESDEEEQEETKKKDFKIKVVDKKGRGVPNALVNLIKDEKVVKGAFTDIDGVAYFYSIPFGKYILEIVKDGEKIEKEANIEESLSEDNNIFEVEFEENNSFISNNLVLILIPLFIIAIIVIILLNKKRKTLNN